MPPDHLTFERALLFWKSPRRARRVSLASECDTIAYAIGDDQRRTRCRLCVYVCFAILMVFLTTAIGFFQISLGAPSHMRGTETEIVEDSHGLFWSRNSRSRNVFQSNWTAYRPALSSMGDSAFGRGGGSPAPDRWWWSLFACADSGPYCGQSLYTSSEPVCARTSAGYPLPVLRMYERVNYFKGAPSTFLKYELLWRGIAVNCSVFGVGLFIALNARTRIVRALRRRAQKCPACGYFLINGCAICPECGHADPNSCGLPPKPGGT